MDEVGTDGSVTVSDEERCRVTLPSSYVADSLTLAYASTAIAAQGRTVDHSLLLMDGPIDAAGLYVPMTRGRESNDVWVVTDQKSAVGSRRRTLRGHAPAVGGRAGNRLRRRLYDLQDIDL